MSPREAELEETVRQLRQQLHVEPERAHVDRLQIGLRLTRHQTLLVAALYEAGSTWLPLSLLEKVLPERGGDVRDLKTVMVQIHYIRTALGQDAILSKQGVGYTLGAPGVLACKRVLAEAGAVA